MKLDICILRFCHRKVHIGSGMWMEQIDNIIHSDTLFNAICWCYSMLYGNHMLEEFLEAFNYSKPLYISSAFPYIDRSIFFFPRPMNVIKLLDGREDKKEVKKVRFVEKEVFEKLLNLEIVDTDNVVINGQFLSSKEIDGIRGIRDYVEYRNMLDRINYSSTVYRARYMLSDYWFAYRVSNEYRDAINASIRLLADEGIGGERSIGSGLFDLEFTSIEVNSPANVNHIITLSLVNPTRVECMSMINDNHSRYMLIRRGGNYTDPRINSKRRSLYMISEGSFLPNIEGRLVNIGDDDKKVYEYGLCFGIGARYEV